MNSHPYHDAPHSGSIARILVVDDVLPNLQLMDCLLSGAGYQVITANDGFEALACVQQVKPDLILLDIMMPGIDGFEVCRRLKADATSHGIPVLFMTALSDTEDKTRGFEAGGVDYITKPISTSEVLARVGVHVRLRAAQAELEAQNAELRVYRDRLEQLVEARTAELSISSQRLRLKGFALGNVREGVFVIDKNQRFAYVNEEACRSLGYAAAELLQMTMTDIDPDWCWDRLRRAGDDSSSHPPPPFEGRHRKRDGSLLPVDVIASTFEHQGARYSLVVARDATQRKLAERQLLLLNEALNRAYDPGFVVDAQLQFRYVNDAAVKVLGYSRDEFIRMTLADIIPAEKYREMRATVQEAVSDQTAFPPFETVCRTKDGRRVTMEVAGAFFKGDGELLHILIARDITERLVAHETIRRMHADWEATLQTMPDILFEFDAEGTYLHIWTHAPEFLIAPREELLGRKIIDKLPTRAAEITMQALREAGIEGTSYGHTIELPFSGETRWFELSVARKAVAPGAEARFIALARNITKRVRTEMKLQESRAQLRSLATRREAAREEERRRIARELHDELGQQLTALRFGVGLIDFNYGATCPGLREAASDLQALVEKTIHTARDVSSSLRPAALDMGLVAALEWLLSDCSRHSNLTYELRPPETDVRMDEEMSIVVFRIIQESLTNAMRHSQGRHVTVSLHNETGQLRIEVRDDGIGFDPEDKGKRRSYGLVGIRERALAVGGEASIFSAPNRGTVVQVRIPFERKKGD